MNMTGKLCVLTYIGWVVSAILALAFVIYVNEVHVIGGTLHIDVAFWIANMFCWIHLWTSVGLLAASHRIEENPHYVDVMEEFENAIIESDD